MKCHSVRKQSLWGLNVKNTFWNVLRAALVHLSKHYGYYHFSAVVFISLTMLSMWKNPQSVTWFIIETATNWHLKYAPNDYQSLKSVRKYLHLRGIVKNIMEKQHEWYWILWLKSFSPSHKLLLPSRRVLEAAEWKKETVAVWSLIIVRSWLKLLLAGDWQEQTLRQLRYCSWEGNLLGTVSRPPPPPPYTFTTLFKHRQDCLPLVSIHFFHCLIVGLWPSIVQVV